MARLNIERQKKLEPFRMNTAKKNIQELGYNVTVISKTCLMFEYKGSIISYYPYSGWATGKTINDGRGLDNLLKQITNGT